MKKCNRCNNLLPLTDFWKKTKSKDGFNSWCKNCCRDSARQSNKSLEDKVKSQLRKISLIQNLVLKEENSRICCKCKKPFIFKKESEIRCKKCESEKFKLYRSKNKEKEKQRVKEYLDKNKEILKEKRKLKNKDKK